MKTWWCRYRVAIDVAFAAFFVALDTVLTLVGASWWPAEPGGLAWTLLVVQALACASLALRQRFPLTILGVFAAFTLLVTVLYQPLGLLTPVNENNVWAPFGAVLAAYGSVLSRRSRPLTFTALGVLTLVTCRPWDPSFVIITIGLARTAIGPLIALYFDARRRLVRALTERAERAEREQELRAEQARADERARLAGEMHDVVTHRVSLMVLQAGALRVSATDERTRQAAEDLREAGCQALAELRDLVGILRTEPEGDEAPGVTGLEALVADATAAGTPAELVGDGDPGLASPVVARTAYRVVREALTNVRKHAPGARVVVEMRYAGSSVEVSVRNTPPTHRPDVALTGTGSGLGLANLRRRIELVHGTLRAGPTADGGYRLDATLPAYVPTAEPTPGVAPEPAVSP